jgi:hypothetical protein
MSTTLTGADKLTNKVAENIVSALKNPEEAIFRSEV